MKARRKGKGGVVRNPDELRGSAIAYKKASERLASFKGDFADQLATLSQLQESFDAAEVQCGIEAQRYLGRRSQADVEGVRFYRTQRTSRSVDAGLLLACHPGLSRMEGLLSVRLGPFDKIVASSAYDSKELLSFVCTETSSKYHVQEIEKQ